VLKIGVRPEFPGQVLEKVVRSFKKVEIKKKFGGSFLKKVACLITWIESKR
jgi:hypothetical protein